LKKKKERKKREEKGAWGQSRKRWRQFGQVSEKRKPKKRRILYEKNNNREIEKME
jgi:hypothetical protein